MFSCSEHSVGEMDNTGESVNEFFWLFQSGLALAQKHQCLWCPVGEHRVTQLVSQPKTFSLKHLVTKDASLGPVVTWLIQIMMTLGTFQGSRTLLHASDKDNRNLISADDLSFCCLDSVLGLWLFIHACLLLASAQLAHITLGPVSVRGSALVN